MTMPHPLTLTAAGLTLAVIFVNGWTDAPNAIATCVATGALPMRRAVALAAAGNLLGAGICAALNPRVAFSVTRLVSLGENIRAAQIALCAALAAIVLWAVAAWRFGIPTSESHALLAGLSGAALALTGHAGGVNRREWGLALGGLALSTVAGFALGFAAARGVTFLFRRTDRRRARRFFDRAQTAGAAATAVLHGAQDGQKFMGVLLLVWGGGQTGAAVSPRTALLVAAVMGLGTAVGGGRIIRTVGRDMVRLTPSQGFSADLSAAACLLVCTLLGLPVSTTHVKTAAVMGAGASRRLSAVRWNKAGEMALAWALTFPGCGLLGFALSRLFLCIF